MTGTDVYRLLSDAEWEYAARAVTSADAPHPDFSWGDELGTGNANCYGCGSQWGNKQTAPVGSFRPNAFGLYDMHANVWQWVEDCYQRDLSDAPTESSIHHAACKGGNRFRVARGGSWRSVSVNLMSSVRVGFHIDRRNRFTGFRLARTL